MDMTPEGEPPGCPLAGVVSAYLPRLAELAREPGLVAAVDQHAAAVCDALAAASGAAAANPAAADADLPGTRVPDRRLLADYVLGFTDALAESGWREPAAPDFAVLRLAAVCRLTREHRLLAR
ncbi:DUF6401 family natural product biosynthesis protein [Yinghuangia soli]|uniref:DUF6401 family natural product biosynthesis protein n=1 Tax=Yinghuangia soli TaxID=2908204 RepID=A0AA41PZT1_9ACTN|nr:DUF6401 family natural product biosynthesis protein [Yinghuangia soli]MCF2528938.1 DUF6401 family natural product biosynthesis protein [Yinghuangia soli]